MAPRNKKAARDALVPDLAGRKVALCDATMHVPPDEVEHFDSNPRRSRPERQTLLEHSLLELGIFKPFLVWRAKPKDGWKVIGGNQRLDAVRSLLARGAEVEGPGLPCTPFRGTSTEARLVALRDNTSDGEWDYEVLPTFLGDLGKDGADLSLTGFMPSEIDDLLKLTTDGALLDHLTFQSLRDEKKDRKRAKSEAADLASGRETLQVGSFIAALLPHSAERLRAAIAAASKRCADLDESVVMVSERFLAESAAGQEPDRDEVPA